MTRDDIDIATRRFLDGELTGEEERDALRRMADDREARAMLRFDLGLRRLLAENPARSAPPGFAERVMRGVEAADAHEVEAHPDTATPHDLAPRPEVAGRPETGRETGRFGALWAGLRRPRTLEWRLSHALLAAAAVVLVATTVAVLGGIPGGSGPWLALRGGGDGTPEPAVEGPSGTSGEAVLAPRADTVLVRFVLEDPGARSVAVAGDFSGWEPIALAPHSRDGEPLWTAVVPLPRGEHRYMFVIDGSRWVTDPLASAYWDDGFGNRNAILSL